MKLTDSEKLKLINGMEIKESSSNGVEIEYILVEDNEANRNILHKIGLTDRDIERNCYPYEGTLDIVAVGFKYADYFDGKVKKFIKDNIKEDIKMIKVRRFFVDKIATNDEIEHKINKFLNENSIDINNVISITFRHGEGAMLFYKS